MDYNGLFIFATQYIVINNSDLQHASWLRRLQVIFQLNQSTSGQVCIHGVKRGIIYCYYINYCKVGPVNLQTELIC